MFHDISETEFTDMQTNFPQEQLPSEEVVRHRGFGVKYDRRLNLGNWESITASMSLWVSIIPEEETNERGITKLDGFGDPIYKPIHLHDCRRRVRDLARTNVRKQFNLARGIDEVEYLGLPEPTTPYDPLMVKTVLMSLKLKRNLGDYASVEPEFSDHCDLRDIYLEYEHVRSANTTGLHIHLHRIWESLWADLNDELARAEGFGETGADFGLPTVEVERVHENENGPANGEITPGAETPTMKNGQGESAQMPANGKLLPPPPPINGKVHHAP
jgi:hypothetical protein